MHKWRGSKGFEDAIQSSQLTFTVFLSGPFLVFSAKMKRREVLKSGSSGVFLFWRRDTRPGQCCFWHSIILEEVSSAVPGTNTLLLIGSLPCFHVPEEKTVTFFTLKCFISQSWYKRGIHIKVDDLCSSDITDGSTGRLNSGWKLSDCPWRGS